MLVALCNATKVGIIAITLHGIARIAECLQVTQIVGTLVVSWHDMIDLKRLFFGRHSAQLAPKLGAFQNFILQCARDISCAFGPMLPDRLAALVGVGADLFITQSNKVCLLLLA